MENTNLETAKKMVRGLVVEKDNRGEKEGVNLRKSSAESLRGALWTAEASEISTYLERVRRVQTEIDEFFEGGEDHEDGYAQKCLAGILDLEPDSDIWEDLMIISLDGPYAKVRERLEEKGVSDRRLSEVEGKVEQLFGGKRGMTDRSMRREGKAEVDPILMKMVIAAMRVVSGEKDRDWFKEQIEKRMLGWKLSQSGMRLRKPIDPGTISAEEGFLFVDFLNQGDGNLPLFHLA